LSSYRPERVAEQIHRELTSMLMFSIKDPRVNAVTVTGVTVTRDLSTAKVYYTVSDDDATARKEAQRGLKSAAPFLRRQLSQLMQMRSIPELRFYYDESIGYGQKIDALLQQVQDDLNDPTADQTTDSE